MICTIVSKHEGPRFEFSRILHGFLVSLCVFFEYPNFHSSLTNISWLSNQWFCIDLKCHWLFVQSGSLLACSSSIGSWIKCNVSRYPPVPSSEGSGLCTLLQWGVAHLSQTYWLFQIQPDQQDGVWSASWWHILVHVSLCGQWKCSGTVWKPDSLESREGK